MNYLESTGKIRFPVASNRSGTAHRGWLELPATLIKGVSKSPELGDQHCVITFEGGEVVAAMPLHAALSLMTAARARLVAERAEAEAETGAVAR